MLGDDQNQVNKCFRKTQKNCRVEPDTWEFDCNKIHKSWGSNVSHNQYHHVDNCNDPVRWDDQNQVNKCFRKTQKNCIVEPDTWEFDCNKSVIIFQIKIWYPHQSIVHKLEMSWGVA